VKESASDFEKPQNVAKRSHAVQRNFQNSTVLPLVSGFRFSNTPATEALVFSNAAFNSSGDEAYSNPMRELNLGAKFGSVHFLWGELVFDEAAFAEFGVEAASGE
jgi:hypothetical protein